MPKMVDAVLWGKASMAMRTGLDVMAEMSGLLLK